MKYFVKVIKLISCLLVVYTALYLGTIFLSHAQYSFYPSCQNILSFSAHDKATLLILSIALIVTSIIQFASLCALKKHITNLIFLLPAILAGLLFTFSTL